MQENKVQKGWVIISGANGGLGKALCEIYLRQGWPVIGLVRSEEKAQTLLAELSYTENFKTIICDVTSPSDCEHLSQEINHDTIGAVINNAGITSIKTFEGLEDLEIIRQVIETNLLGAIQLTGALLPSIKRSAASIINISSVLGFAPVYGRTAYAASKFGMEGFFRTLQTELISDGVYSLMVYPTFISTGIRTEEMNKKTTGEILTADFCAEKIYHTHQSRKKRTLLLGATAKKSYWIYKFFPRLYEKLMLKSMKEKVSESNKKNETA